MDIKIGAMVVVVESAFAGRIGTVTSLHAARSLSFPDGFFRKTNGCPAARLDDGKIYCVHMLRPLPDEGDVRDYDERADMTCPNVVAPEIKEPETV